MFLMVMNILAFVYSVFYHFEHKKVTSSSLNKNFNKYKFVYYLEYTNFVEENSDKKQNNSLV